MHRQQANHRGLSHQHGVMQRCHAPWIFGVHIGAARQQERQQRLITRRRRPLWGGEPARLMKAVGGYAPRSLDMDQVRILLRQRFHPT
jgi:hypothetical protein